MSVVPLHQLGKAGRAAKASRQQVASSLIGGLKKRAATIAKLDKAANQIYAAFTAKNRTFGRAKVAQLKQTLAKMERSVARLALSTDCNTRVALARAMPTSKLVAQAADVATLRAKLASLRAVADVTLDGVDDENALLQVDENGYLVQPPVDGQDGVVPEVVDPTQQTAADETTVADPDALVQDFDQAYTDETGPEAIPAVPATAGRRRRADDTTSDPAVDPAALPTDDDDGLNVDLQNLGIDDTISDDILTDPDDPALDDPAAQPAAVTARSRGAMLRSASRSKSDRSHVVL